jgi:macrophage erythroblast attacher
MQSTLEFELRLQEFIELSRTRTRESITEAMSYASRHLLPLLTSGPPGSAKGAEKLSAGEDAEENEAHLRMCAQVRRAMGLLAMPPGKWAYSVSTAPLQSLTAAHAHLQDLYSEDRWHTLSRSFRECALQIHSLPPQPILHIALSAGLSSLKLPACYSHETARGAAGATQPPAHLGGRTWGDTTSVPLGGAPSVTAPAVTLPSAAPLTSGGLLASSPPSSAAARSSSALGHARDSELGDERNANCPVCDADGLGQLAKEVPWSHHTNSTLVCRISGRVMDENDPPLCLPNGRVYSRTVRVRCAAEPRRICIN